MTDEYGRDPPMRVLIELCDRRIASCWKIHYFAEKAYKRGDLSLKDFKFIKNKLSKAMHQFDRIKALLNEPHSCETCARASGSISDEEWDCSIADRLTEADIDMCRDGCCPRWVRREEESEEESDG